MTPVGLTSIGALSEIQKIAPIPPVTSETPSTELREDIVSVLEHLHPHDVPSLLEIFEPPDHVENASHAASLIATLVEHSRAGEIAHVDEIVRHIAELSPARAEQLPDHPELSDTRSEIASTVRHLSVAAKAEAEHAVTQISSQLSDTSRLAALWHSEPHALIEVCEKLIGFGGLGNYRKAQRLAASMHPDRVVIVDLNVTPLLDTRELRWRVTNNFGLLPSGPALAGLLGILLFVIAAAEYFLR